MTDQPAPPPKRQLSKPATYALFALCGLIYLMSDDIGALVERAENATWMFSAPDKRPTGTWQGEFLGRTISLHLELDTLSDKDSSGRSSNQNGFFYKRLESDRGVQTVKGTLSVSASNGKTDRFETEGSPNLRGTHVVLNVHNADGVAGIMIEQADVTFDPPNATASLRYRLPGTRKTGGYYTGGVLWSAVPQPGVVKMERTGL